MSIFSFLKDKVIFLLVQVMIIVFISFVLNVFKAGLDVIIFVDLVIIVATVGFIIYEYINKYTYYKELYKIFNKLEEKYFISQLIKECDFFEGKILVDLFRKLTKSMNDKIAKYKISNEDYREYIETWIHEVKIPISCINLICENNLSEFTSNILDETKRIELFVEQALFYARSTNLEKDYRINDLKLENLVKTVVKNNSKQLINCKCKVDFENLDYIVFCDEKWVIFILGQIISNSIKYRREEFSIKFFSKESKTNVILYIQDNGIGIYEGDLDRIFEKGFTGKNGRKNLKSTGIGLYLCKVLCDKMNLKIDAISCVGKGTTIAITFPKDKSILFE